MNVDVGEWRRQRILIIAVAYASALFFTACNPRSDYLEIPNDPETIARGKASFEQDCSACHNFRQDGIGPQLGGVTQSVSIEWLRKFIRDPQAVVESGDERGQKLLARYKTMMPAFGHYTDDELTEIIAYLHTQAPPVRSTAKADSPEAVKDPIPEGIEQSDLLVAVEYVAQIPVTAHKGFPTRITKLDFITGTDRRFIVDIRGTLYELRDGNPEVYMDMVGLKSEFIDAPGLATGFGSFSFHPDFIHNGLLYTSHTEKPGKVKANFHFADSIPATVQWVISEWKTDQPQAFPFRGVNRELFRIDMVTGIHGVQELIFNPNSKQGDEDYGLLYIGIGDGGCVENGYPFLVQNIERPWGSIFRIDPRKDDATGKPYGIPPTNPFAGHSNKQALGELYAYGFRNPHRITWTTRGQMLVSNIGQAQIESICLVESGRNYGWPIREGTFVSNPYGDLEKIFPLPENDDIYGVTYPVAQYDHDEGLAVSGGFEYSGSTIAELKDKYLFADMNNGRLYYIELNEVTQGRIATIREWKIALNGKSVTTAELHGRKRVDLRFGKDHNGDIYIFSKQDGKVYRLAGTRHTISKL